MSGSTSDGMLALPERTRLLYIGPMKTGTTAIQTAAKQQRKNLLDHGVRYPGNRLNHRTEFGALIRRSTEIARRAGSVSAGYLNAEHGGVPDMRYWDELKTEIENDTTRRMLVTHEFVSQADDATCEKIVDELGPERLHVAITLRSPAAMLPSYWSQNLKAAAQTEPFESWLSRLYDPHQHNPLSAGFLRGYDQGALVQRWAELVGPNNVTVIVADHSHPGLLTDTFEALLDLPAGMLAREEETNRSLTVVEAGLFRKLNLSLSENQVDWRAFYDLVTKGAVERGVLDRTPAKDEPRMRLPEWANEAARRDGQRFAEHIRESGARVVGDLESLGNAPQAREHVEAGAVPVDISVRALTGAVLAGQAAQRRADRGNEQAMAAREKNQRLRAELNTVRDELKRERNRTLYHRTRGMSQAERIDHTAAAYSTRELLAIVQRRLVHKVRTGKSHPLTPVPPTRKCRADRS